ncbi:MAG: amino acid racemase [Patescibacteria group bacterium]|nr:amino acid racemase [Patescibacteria group bacterium]
MKYKTIGILGGMGPLATLDFEHKLLSLVVAKSDQDYPTIISFNDPSIPDRTDALIGTGESPLPRLVENAEKLKNAGVELICMPCNTAHAFLPELKRTVKEVEFVDMIDATVSVIERLRMQHVGVLCTDGTRMSGTFEAALEKRGLTTIYPSLDEQKSFVMDAIYGPMGIKAGNIFTGRVLLEHAAESLVNNGAQCVILGCTEIAMALDNGEVPYLDSSLILARETLNRADKTKSESIEASKIIQTHKFAAFSTNTFPLITG